MAFVDTEELAGRALPPDASLPHRYSRSIGADGYQAALERELADQRSREVADRSLVAPGLAPVVEPDGRLTQADVGRLVDVMLGAALKRLDAEAAAARSESEARVAAAVRKAALVAPVGDVAACSTEGAGGFLPTTGPSAPRVREGIGASLQEAELDQGDETGAAPPPDLFGSDPIGLRDPAEVYERFWAGAPDEHPALGRLRRWARWEVR